MATPGAEQWFIGLVTADGPDAEAKMQRLAEFAYELGGLTIAAVAYEETFAGLPEAEQQRQQQLDAPLTRVIHELVAPRSTHSLFEKLGRAGIYCVRDALVLGRSRVRRIAALTLLQQRHVAAGIAAHCPDEQYLEDPSPADVALLCVRLDQVHSGVIPRLWGEIRQGSEDIGQSRITVDQLLAEDFRPPEDFWLWDKAYDHSPVRLEAFRFAAEFLAARAQSQR